MEKNIKFRKITKKFLWNYLFSKWPGSRSGMKFQNPGSGFPDFRRVGIETGIGIAKGREFPLDPGRDPDPVLPYWQGSHRAIRILEFFKRRANGRTAGRGWKRRKGKACISILAGILILGGGERGNHHQHLSSREGDRGAQRKPEGMTVIFHCYFIDILRKNPCSKKFDLF